MEKMQVAEDQKLFEASRAENQKLQAHIMEKMEDREQKFLSKIERKLEATTDKLQEISIKCESYQKVPVG